MKNLRTLKFYDLTKLPGYWFRVVQHCPDRTKTFENDLKNEITVVANYLARGSVNAHLHFPKYIIDDTDRTWLSVLVTTTHQTPLNHKILDFDNGMNFVEVSGRFKASRIVSTKINYLRYGKLAKTLTKEIGKVNE